METLAEIVIKIASIPVVISGIYAFFKFRYLNSELKIFSYFLFLSLLIEIISKILWFLSLNNLPLLHIYVFSGYILQSWFYARVLKEFINQKIIWSLVIFFCSFSIVNSVLIQPITTFNTYAIGLQAILIIIYSLSTFIFFLNELVRNEKREIIKSLNWINSGFFIYYVSSLLVFYFSNYFVDYFSTEVNQYLWAIHTFFLIAMYVCFFIGLWNQPKLVNGID